MSASCAPSAACWRSVAPALSRRPRSRHGDSARSARATPGRRAARFPYRRRRRYPQARRSAPSWSPAGRRRSRGWLGSFADDTSERVQGPVRAPIAADHGLVSPCCCARDRYRLAGIACNTSRSRPNHLMATTMSKLLKAYDRSRVPLYIQVAAVMRQRIERRQWQPGQKISTLVELEREFEVARVTVRQAVDILRQEGLLHCHQGRGTFVAEKPPSRHWLELATDWAILIDSIKDNVPKRIKADRPPAYPEL